MTVQTAATMKSCSVSLMARLDVQDSPQEKPTLPGSRAIIGMSDSWARRAELRREGRKFGFGPDNQVIADYPELRI